LYQKALKNTYYVIKYFFKIKIILNIGYESNIANLIKNRLEIETEYNSKYLEVFRGIRSQLTNLLDGNSDSKFKSIKYLLAYFLNSEKNIYLFFREDIN